MKNIDLKRYKRLFAFGCSFTSYIYPTWADILYKSMQENIPFNNFGKAGGGNTFISNRITEANRKYKFDKDDLVVVMWSTNCRIDYYLTENGGWRTPGNIYTQDMLSQEIVRQFDDLNWYLMRDFSTIDLTTTYLESLECDCLKFLSVPQNYEPLMNHNTSMMSNLTSDICKTYKEVFDKYQISMYEFMKFEWSTEIKYQHPEFGLTIDYHPTPVDYLNYLIKCNVPLSQESIDYANNAFDILTKPNQTHRGIIKTFSECDERLSMAFKELW
jgi:hypothetical protein